MGRRDGGARRRRPRRAAGHPRPPADRGVPPFGAEVDRRPPWPATRSRAPCPRCVRRPPPASSGCSPPRLICGATTVCLVGTHLIRAAHDHGIGELQAAGLVADRGVRPDRRHHLGLPHRPPGPRTPAVQLRGPAGPVALLPAARAGGDRPRDGGVRRGPRPRLGRHRPDHRRRVRARAGRGGVRLDLRRPPDGGGRRRLGGRAAVRASRRSRRPRPSRRLAR